ncbi:MAG TPA: hypothetical protein VFE44_00965 [Thermoanaerobaculia bacterium]|nr:hypothetical protein [Thermoanaerobaculia bacterium]
MRRIFVICAAVASLAAEAAIAQNQVSNSNFDTEIPPWSEGAAVTWSSIDFQGSPSSGSTLLTNTSGSAGGAIQMNQCVAGGVSAGASYVLGGQVFIPSEQGSTVD